MGKDRYLDNGDNIHLMLYKCNFMADECETCVNVSEKYDCGWCGVWCQVENQCENQQWIGRNQSCLTTTTYSPSDGIEETTTKPTLNATAAAGSLDNTIYGRCADFGTCSQRCEEKGSRRVICGCFEGYELETDGHTCKSIDSSVPYLLFSNRYQLGRIDLQSPDLREDVLKSSLENVITVDFYHSDIDEYIFWSDISENKIYRGVLTEDGGSTSLTDIKPIVETGLGSTEGLAVDWVGENLYWTDSTYSSVRIEVSKLNGSFRRTLISSNMEKPRSICVDPNEGILFWSDWGDENPRIEKASMSGSGRSTVVRVRNMMDRGGWPNMLTLDYNLKRIYWVDAKFDTIRCAKYDGSDNREILQSSEILSHPYGISLFETNVYWSDWHTKTIRSANKFNGSNVQTVRGTKRLKKEQTFDVKVQHPSRQPRPKFNPCAMDNGGCSHLCLLSFNSTRECACPHKMTLSEGNDTCQSIGETTTVDTSNINNTTTSGSCKDTFFRCGGGGRCFPTFWKCDGEVDCDDGSDEERCDENICSENQFRCEKSGNCILLRWKCDYDEDCNDGSDEFNCTRATCDDNNFACQTNGRCLPNRWRCDNEPDCPDGSDELNCTDGTAQPTSTIISDLNTTSDIETTTSYRMDITTDIVSKCNQLEFQCGDSGQCIPEWWRCDGAVDCSDATDELSCEETTCTDDQFRCETSGKCIAIEWKCDYKADCTDGSDEFNCIETTTQPADTTVTDSILTQDIPDTTIVDIDTTTDTVQKCKVSEFECGVSDKPNSVNQCIPSYWKCDGDVDCWDARDELLCNGTCPDDLFRCKESGKCVPLPWRCDHQKDCVDGSDEDNCTGTYKNCTEREFKCASGNCVPKSFLCDGDDDCNDNSDEKSCADKICNNQEFQCKSSRTCIYIDWKCDGEKDCSDGSDEFHCSEIVCGVNEVRCNGSGACIPFGFKCDGDNDCNDGSDELNCAKEPCFDTQFRCNRSQNCIPTQWECDGSEDCNDGSDEHGNCTREIVTTEDTITEHTATDVTTADINATAKPAFSCSDNSIFKFRCNETTQCFPIHYICNGVTDCDDGSDEYGCPETTTSDGKPTEKTENICLSHEVRCNVSRECVPISWLCDGGKDCKDKSDEENCRINYCLNYRHFHCKESGICIPPDWRCDGEIDCRDGSDEHNCTDSEDTTVASTTEYSEEVCESYQVRCNQSRECIHKWLVCDRVKNCEDGSDELNCPNIEATTVASTTEYAVRGRGTPLRLVRFEVPKLATEGDNVELFCEFTHDSDISLYSVKWYKDLKEFFRYSPGSGDQYKFFKIEGLNVFANSTAHASIVSLRSLDTTNSGIYRCEVTTDFPEFLTVSDESSLFVKEVRDITQKCNDSDFQCGVTNQCIPSSWKCDGDVDCNDASDELLCDEKIHECRQNEFTCNNLKCVERNWVCDDEDDCGDGSDELNCTDASNYNDTDATINTYATDITSTDTTTDTIDDDTATTVDTITTDITTALNTSTESSDCDEESFRCSSACFPNSWKCDGDIDCDDGSDELNCDVIKRCESHQFECQSGYCTFKVWVCDGEKDCADGTDELNCTESTTAATEITTGATDHSTEPTDSGSIRCPESFYPFETRCLHIHTFPRRWLRAISWCENLNATLATFGSDRDAMLRFKNFLVKKSLIGWNYWVEVTPDRNHGQNPLSTKDVAIPIWFLNGRKCQKSFYPVQRANCTFIDNADFGIYSASNCNEFAGFICQAKNNN